ncbi:4Fe-4S single cluster domain-containing protein [Janthinobacterium sp. 78]|uniref:4Fe-4S single cluster domain-containing protein n=1 Tax=Janthinobacterium sp. 78 TaxID=2135631 RepID=UPI000E31AE4F|nr:4Fe-4S single cluster domain-containing protein [Janthinobacterium sp. 78]
METPMLNLAAWVACTEMEGPGRRFAIWTQGCHLRCKHCCNQSYLPLVPREIVPALHLLPAILEARDRQGVEGITLLGGEPLIQARGLSLLAQAVRANGITVMMFTGYVLDSPAQAMPDGAQDLLAACDVVVDGPFVAARAERSRNWVGSTNQRFHYFTDAYDTAIETDIRYRNGIEIRFEQSGTLRVNGFPFLT